jgi:hypothetical protein
VFADNDRVSIGNSITVQQDESVGDVVCIGCSIHMAGSCGDIVTVGGSIDVDGDVNGDAVVVFGSMRLNEDASVAGNAVAIGGRVLRHPNATVKGEVSSRSGIPILIGIVVAPLLPLILIVALIVWLVNRSRRPAPLPPQQRV